MDLISVGRWAMIVVGAMALLAAIWITLKGRRSLTMWIFGVLLLGMGAFGMEFIPKYSDWLGKVSDLVKNPGKESYDTFFTGVSKQTLPAEIQQIGIEYAINHPVAGMDSILMNITERTPMNTDGWRALTWATENLRGKERVIDQILQSRPRPELVQGFDKVTGDQVYDRLAKLPPEKLRTLEIDTKSIRNYRPTIDNFPVRRTK